MADTLPNMGYTLILDSYREWNYMETVTYKALANGQDPRALFYEDVIDGFALPFF